MIIRCSLLALAEEKDVGPGTAGSNVLGLALIRDDEARVGRRRGGRGGRGRRYEKPVQ